MSEYKIGFAPSDIANNINPDYRLPEAIHKLSKLAVNSGSGIELEMEESFEFPKYIKPVNLSFLGVHQPSGGVDINDSEQKEESIAKIKSSMIMADNIRADYFTVHLQTKDKWDGVDARKHYIQEGLDVFDELVDFYRLNNFTYKIFIENLEYPKYPATIEEIEEVSKIINNRSDYPGGIVLDIGHLWRTRILMAENNIFHEGQELPYSEYLRTALYGTQFSEEIEAFHITGCGGYQTHLLPQISIEEPQDRQIKPDEYYFRTLARMVLLYVKSNDYKHFIVNEAFGHSYETVIDNNQLILGIDSE